MLSLIQWSLKVCVALIVILVVGVIATITLLDPNQFKETLQRQVAHHTGRELQLNGPLYWHLDPGLSIEAYDVALSNAPNTKTPFLKLKKAQFDISIFSFFRGKGLSMIKLEGLDLELNRNTFGYANWENINSILTNNAAQYLSWLKPYNLILKDAHITWKDDFQHQHITLKNLELSTLKPSSPTADLKPLYAQFYLENNLENQYSGTVTLTTNWDVEPNPATVVFQNIELVCHFDTLPPVQLTGDLRFKQLQDNPVIEGKVQTVNLALNRWLHEFKTPLQIPIDKLHVKTAFRYQAPILELSSFALSFDNYGLLEGSLKTELTHGFSKKMIMDGFLHGKKLRLGTVPITEFSAFFEAQNGLVHFTQINAEAGNSQHQGSAQVDFRTSTPAYTIESDFSAFEVNDFLTLVGHKKRVHGKIQGKSSLVTRGSTQEECLRNLNGQISLTLTDGKLHGIDLYPLLKHAQSTVSGLSENLLSKQSVNVEAVLTAELGEWKQQALHNEQLYTPFREIEMDFLVENGKLTTNTFKLWHSQYTINGKGTLDLINHDAEYEANALLNHVKYDTTHSLSPLLKETPLTIQIKGPLKDLMIKPHLGHYAKKIINNLGSPQLEFKEQEPNNSPESEHELEQLFTGQ